MEFIQTIQANPKLSIIAFSFLLSFFITVITKLLTDGERMKELKTNQKELQQKIKDHKHDPHKIAEFQKEMFSNMGETMKHSFKPMMITIVPVIIFFSWIRGVFSETTISSTWFWWYIGTSLVSSTILRKLFKMN